MTKLTNEQILEAAILKANQNGWICPCAEEGDDCPFVIGWGKPVLVMYQDADTTEVLHIEDILFNHDFAKAFWGEEMQYCSYDELGDCSDKCQSMWQYHLQQMVLEENPLSYIAKFL